MRYGLLAFAVPTGILACAQACDAQVFLTEDQALRSLFDNSRIDRQGKTLKDEDRQALTKATGLRFPESSFTFFVAERDGKALGYALVMNELGKSEPITFMVAMSPEHRVVDVLVLVFRESRGAEVRETRFLRQFKGKQANDPITINNDIINYSGATLSSKAITRGVKRALGLLNHFYPASKSSQEFSPAFMLPASSVPGQPGVYRQVRYMMGTLCDIQLEADSSAHASAAASAAFSEIRRLERIFSIYDSDSELSYINREASRAPVQASSDMWALIRAAVRYSRATSGAVDVTVGPLLRAGGFRACSNEPADVLRCVGIDKISLDLSSQTVRFTVEGMEIDFGGLAKGYAARRAANVLRRWDTSSTLINLGGSSIFTTGGRRDWLVGIADPASPNRYAAVLAVKPGTAVTCSGTYERYVETSAGAASHIFDPRSGKALTGLRSAVAITKSPLLGEVLSKMFLLQQTPEVSGRDYLLLTGSRENATVVQSNLSQTVLFTPQEES